MLKLHPQPHAGGRAAGRRVAPGPWLSASRAGAVRLAHVRRDRAGGGADLCGATIVHESVGVGGRRLHGREAPAGGGRPGRDRGRRRARARPGAARAARKSHELLPAFLHRVKCGTATPFAAALFSVARALEAACAADGPAAWGPARPVLVADRRQEPPAPLREWGEWGELAHRLAGDERLTTTSRARFAQLEHYYEALRLLVVSWEAAPDAAATYLRMVGAGRAPRTRRLLGWRPGDLAVPRAPLQRAQGQACGP